MNARRNYTSGFTLTEVLVATMLLSIVMTAVYTLFFTVISTWRSEENDEGLHRKARNVLGAMRQEYDNIHASGSYFFEGAGDEFTLYAVTQPMDVESGEGRHLIRVRYHYDAANQQLEREEALVDEALPAVVRNADTFDRGRIKVKDEAHFVVATDVTEFKVRYLWVEWPDAAYWRDKPAPIEPVAANCHRIGWGMPQAIEVDLAFAPKARGGAPLTVTARFPTRTFTRQRDHWELSRMLEGNP